MALTAAPIGPQVGPQIGSKIDFQGPFKNSMGFAQSSKESASKNKAGEKSEKKPWLVTRICQITVDWVQTTSGVKNFGKLISQISSWANIFFANHAGPKGKVALDHLSAAGKLGKNSKNFIAMVAELPKALWTLKDKTLQLKNVVLSTKTSTKEKVKAATQWFLGVNGLVSPVHDTVEVLSAVKAIPMNATAMMALDGVNYGALGIASVDQIHESTKKIADAPSALSDSKKASEMGKKTARYRMLEIAKWVSYFALACIGLVGLLIAVAIGVALIPGWVTLACASSALFFTFMGHYYKNLADPKGVYIDKTLKSVVAARA